MASGMGSVIFNFGAAPGTNVVTITVSDAAIGAASEIEAYISGLDFTGDHNAFEHSIVKLGGMEIVPISRTPGVGFTLQAATNLRLTGQLKARYVWSD
jgi:hypothetical protein